MPPSSDHDNFNPLNCNPHPSKLTQKASAGVQIPTKSGRKNGTAKDPNNGGGVLAAVTKNAKASNAKSAKFPSPEMQPVASPSNGHAVTSPLLDALSSGGGLDNSTANTQEWAKNVPAYSSSPGNLISLGESPPMFSHEDRLANYGWTTREQRGSPNGYVSSASPPISRRRPLSYQLDGNFPQAIEDHRSQVASYAARRSSMYSQHPRYPQHHPLPHQVQAHFYGAPAPSLLLSPPAPGLTAGDNGYYCGFDVLPKATSKSPDDVVLTGYEGGIKIYAVSKRGLHKISSISGLRGGVYNAKILSSKQGKTSRQFPLIAMVVHGPASTSCDASSGGGGTPPSEGVSIGQADVFRGSPVIHGQSVHENEPLESYQTTVEVYSMSTKEHIATLLSTPKTRPGTPSLRAPPPVGSLTIFSDGGYTVITSGTTGETWIFQGDKAVTSHERFQCIGKVWTAVQHGSSSTGGQVDGDWNPPDLSTVRMQFKASILSLNGRWLAYCPSVPSSQISLRASVPGLSSVGKIPGLASLAPPQLPNLNCTTETPGGESKVKQIVQISTQKFIEAGNYLTERGIQAWNNYRKPANSPSNGATPYQVHSNTGQQFPPTHGGSAPAPLVVKDPGLISILDLEVLSQHTATGVVPHPLATFRAPHGCSFLSFAPSGLALFSASSKGDIQCVWDLMRIQYARSSLLKGAYQGAGTQNPHVREIAQFTRMTIARIVEVVWSAPHGERFVMVTDAGTAHVLDLPASSFTWPPPRRRTPAPNPGAPTSEVSNAALAATGVATSAVSSLWTAAKPLVNRRRRSSTGISARTVTSQAGHGTQALAAGISRSVGAATGKMNQMRKSSSAKLHVPQGSVLPSKACVMVLNSKRNDAVVVVGGGIVRYYPIKHRRADRPADKQKASRGANYTEFRVPSLPDVRHNPGFANDLSQGGDFELTERDIEESRWEARQSPSPGPRGHGTESSIPQAEIESNPPYQPFHTDRRVNLYIYSYEEVPPTSPSVSALLAPTQLTNEAKPLSSTGATTVWAFGGPIKTKKLEVGPTHTPEDDYDFSSDLRALPPSAMERVMRVSGSLEDMEQIVITTRRRKGVSGLAGDIPGEIEEGFFEDDCEVLDFASQRV